MDYENSGNPARFDSPCGYRNSCDTGIFNPKDLASGAKMMNCEECTEETSSLKYVDTKGWLCPECYDRFRKEKQNLKVVKI